MPALIRRPDGPVPGLDLDALTALVIPLSRRLAGAIPGDMAAAIGAFLADVVAATGADGCLLLEFNPFEPEPRVHHAAAMASDHAAFTPDVEPESWLVERLSRGQLVVIASRDDLPREARARREAFLHAGGGALLGVPVSVAGQVVCALVIDSTSTPHPWPAALIEQLQLLLEIVAGALLRERSERKLRADVAVIEQLNAKLLADNVYLKEEIKTYHDFDDIVGESASLRVALARVAQVAPTNSTVLLLGPTGTGKELFARALHERSRRHARPMIRVNCAALPPTLVESELFGHERGAFTGAVTMRQGRFELADGGTIFLDEIGDLPHDIQVKFLRVLQEGEFERVGSSRTRKVDVRVIAATHKDLDAAIADGSFREDLYYRLSVYPIRLPSLKDRLEDIPGLVWFFINRHQRNLGRHIKHVPPSVIEALQGHTWPGNIRELENVVERAMIASNGDVLELDEPSKFGRPRPMAESGHDGVPDALDTVQRAHIEAVLEQCGWRVNGVGNAAERLGIHPNTLRFRMKKLGVTRPPTASRESM